MKKLLYFPVIAGICLLSCNERFSDDNTHKDLSLAKNDRTHKVADIKLDEDTDLSQAFHTIATGFLDVDKQEQVALSIRISDNRLSISPADIDNNLQKSEQLGWNIYNTCPTSDCLEWALQESVKDLESQNNSKECLQLHITKSFHNYKIKGKSIECGSLSLSLNE